jgi:hypothetical protein
MDQELSSEEKDWLRRFRARRTPAVPRQVTVDSALFVVDETQTDVRFGLTFTLPAPPAPQTSSTVGPSSYATSENPIRPTKRTVSQMTASLVSKTIPRLGANAPHHRPVAPSPTPSSSTPGTPLAQDFEHLLAERDALILRMLEMMAMMAEQIKDAKGDFRGSTGAATIRSGRKKLKVDRSKLEQGHLYLVKVRTITLSLILHV